MIGSGVDEQALRVVDPLDPTHPTDVARLAVEEVVHLFAWTRTDALVMSADGLWRIRGTARERLSQPVSLSEVEDRKFKAPPPSTS